MSLKSDQESLAYAAFDLWMSWQLEKLVNQWIELAAPIDRDTWLDPHLLGADNGMNMGIDPLDGRGARDQRRQPR